MGSSVARGHSCATDGRKAVAELHAALSQPDLALVVFFCSPEYDLDAVADEIRSRFAGVAVVGCTTAGEIGPAGCRQHSLVGASFSQAEFSVVAGGLEHLQEFQAAWAATLTEDLVEGLKRTAPVTPDASFAMLLIDGTSVREEAVTYALQQQLGAIPLVGGSAGDGLRFEKAFVYFDGAFHRDAAALVIVTTSAPFEVLRVQHLVATQELMVVTAADAERRVVYELDGLPAAERYAALVGADVEDLDPARLAEVAVVVTIGGTNYVRSIQQANPDGSLTFFSAIETGIVLRPAAGVDLLGNLAAGLSEVHQRIGDPQLMLVFDCILRRLEMSRREIVEPVEAVFAENNAIGFNTYGEQHCGYHVNQTLTGIAIGRAPDA